MLSQAVWLQLSQPTRKEIARLLSIPRSGGTEVVDGRIVSDGYTMNDLMLIDLEKLQTYLKSAERDFYVLFDQLVKKIENVEEPIVDLPREEKLEFVGPSTDLTPEALENFVEQAAPEVVEEPKKKRSRRNKN